MLAVARVNNRKIDGLSRLVTGMCGGLSRSGGMCGALLGGIAAVGMMFGRDTPEDDKTLCYRVNYQLIQEFRHIFGSSNCFGVLPCDISTREGAQVFQCEALGERICPGVAERTAALVQKLISLKQDMTHPLI